MSRTNVFWASAEAIGPGGDSLKDEEKASG